MKNYFNLLLESERVSVTFPKLKGTKYGFLVGNVINTLIFVFVLYNILGGSADLYTLCMMTVYVISPLRYFKVELIHSLPITAKKLRNWDLKILALYMLLIMPFSFVLYFIKPFNQSDPIAWYVASSPTIENIAVGICTGFTLSLLLRIFKGFEPYRFIQSKIISVFAYILTGVIGIYGVHYLNLWLIGIF